MSESNGLLDRLSRAEGVQAEIIETIQAISRAVGPNEVQSRLGDIKREKMSQLVSDAVKNGKLEAVDKVVDGSFVVGQQSDKDGNPMFPGRFQVFVGEMIEDVRKEILGKRVDDVIKLSDGSSLKIEEVYGLPTERKAEPKAKKAKKTPVTPAVPAN